MLWTLVENREHKNSRILQSSIRADPRKSAAKESAPKLPQKFECGSGQPPQPHRFTWFPACLCHRCAVERPLQPDSARKECRICQSQLPIMISRSIISRSRSQINHPASQIRNRCGGQRPCPLRRAKQGEEAANARATSSRFRAFLECPPAIHPRESPAAAGSAAIIRRAQELSRFAEPTLIHFVAARNTKTFPRCAETVDDETSLWKTEEN